MKRRTKLLFLILAATVLTTTVMIGYDHTNKMKELDGSLPLYQIQESTYVIPQMTNEIPNFVVEQSPPPTSIPLPEPAAYEEIAACITDDEIETLARLLFLEAGNQSIEGQRAVIEVVFNRILSDEFPDTINDVVYAKNQFSPAHLIPSTTPTEVQYDVIQTVLTDTETILDRGVVFFSRKQYNDYLYKQIGDHYFCYSKSYYETYMKGQQNNEA